MEIKTRYAIRRAVAKRKMRIKGKFVKQGNERNKVENANYKFEIPIIEQIGRAHV